MKLQFFLFLLIFSFHLQAQFVETIVHSHPKIVDGLYVDPTGNIYTSSGGLVGGIQIGKYDINLNSYNPNFALGFSGPINIASYRDSLLIVTNFDNGTVSSYNLNTSISTVIATGLHGPAGIAIDSLENIYITNWGTYQGAAGHWIHKISSTGNLSIYVDSSALIRPQAITINHLGELIVHSNQNLYKVNSLDSSLQHWVSLGFGIGNMTFRHKDSSIYAATGSNRKIMKINSQGVISTYSGSTQGFLDGPIGLAKFNSPLGIAFTSSEDTLYITDVGNIRRLRRIVLSQTVGETEFINSIESIYPNPIDDLCYINLKDHGKSTIEIYNLNGQLVLSEDKNGRHVSINLDQLHSGIYLLRMINNNTIVTQKIIKK